MRLFFAVELPTEVQNVLGKLRPADNAAYRWADPLLLHVTLAFLGEQPEERLDVLKAVGAAAAKASSRGHLTLGEPGSFGTRKAPRVLWVGLDGDVVTLNALQSHVTKELLKAGFSLEDRAFSPHITLARRRDTARTGPPDNWPPTLQKVQFEMDHLTLFQSRLSPRGPTYVPLATFPLH